MDYVECVSQCSSQMFYCCKHGKKKQEKVKNICLTHLDKDNHPLHANADQSKISTLERLTLVGNSILNT